MEIFINLTFAIFPFYSILYALCMIGSSVGTNLMASLHVYAFIWLCFSVSMAGYAFMFLVAVKQFRTTLMRGWMRNRVLHISSEHHGEPGEQQVNVKVYTVSVEGTKRLEELGNIWNRAYLSKGK